MSDSKPVVCSLTTKALVGRTLEWSDLHALAHSATELEHGAVLELPITYGGAVHELAERELECCGTWLDIDIVDGPGSVTIRLTTSKPSGVPIIKEMAGLGGGPRPLDSLR